MVHFWGLLLTLTIISALAISIHSLTITLRENDWNKSVIETVDQNTADTTIWGMITESPEAKVTKSNIVISGEAADSLIISLKVNNVLTAAVLPKKGVFTFENVELEIGANEIIVYAMNTGGAVTVLQKLTTDYGSKRLSFMSRNITRGKRARQQLALTFDGGSGNGATNDILDILDEKNITCTMFLTGSFIKRFKQETKRIVAEGHEVGNHTWSHPHLTTFAENSRHDTQPEATRKMLQHELLSTAKLFNKTTGQKMAPYWRAPFGEHNNDVRQWAAELGYLQIGWTHGNDGTMDSMDWVADTSSAIYKSSQRVLKDLLHFGDSTDVKANGSIILMHLDTQRQTDPVHRIIPTFVDSMRARGYEFVTVSELLKSKSKETIISKK
jgi:peptidoglycan/xylan/chitin deacetylase (PgdA/CDA1 family)